MKRYDTMTIGHISLDFNIDWLDNQIVEVGGAVIYSSAAAYAGGYKVAAVTKLASADRDRLSEFVIPAEDVYCLPSAVSTSIRNKYFTADKERRSCTCLGQADPFTIADIPEAEVGVYHLAGLIYGDFDGELISALSEKGKVAVDVQALLRHAGGKNGEMYFEDWADKKKYLPYIDYLKTDAAEAEILTGQPDRYLAARMLHDWGAKEVVITHNTEVIAYDGGEIYACPIRARNLSGRSGRGDTTFAAYITERQKASVQKALLWATATVSAKMEKPGPYRGSRSDIEEYIKEFYPDFGRERL
ncbi:MAG TPA: ribokinase [Candidatus Ornithoclostridium excrementipullorum]|nr:ribokinase [Candidatus Ornithoclostridium excrementipullorum]